MIPATTSIPYNQLRQSQELNAEEQVQQQQEGQSDSSENGLVSTFLKAEEVVEKILQHRRDELAKSSMNVLLPSFDSQREAQRKTALEMEKWVRENSDKLFTRKVAGPLHYGMSLSQMKDAIEQKFREMASSGQLMTKNSLSETHSPADFDPPKNSNDMTRFWGAEFLKSNLPDHLSLEGLRVADQFLIVDDEATEIQVQVSHGEVPTLSFITNVTDAEILSKKIEGSPIGKSYQRKLSKKIGYNAVIGDRVKRDSNGIDWIVATGIRNFSFPYQEESVWKLEDHLKARFKVLAGEEYNQSHQTFKISLSFMDKRPAKMVE